MVQDISAETQPTEEEDIETVLSILRENAGKLSELDSRFERVEELNKEILTGISYLRVRSRKIGRRQAGGANKAQS